MEKMWEFDYKIGGLGVTLFVSAFSKEEAITKMRKLVEVEFTSGDVNINLYFYNHELPFERTEEFEYDSEEEE